MQRRLALLVSCTALWALPGPLFAQADFPVLGRFFTRAASLDEGAEKEAKEKRGDNGKDDKADKEAPKHIRDNGFLVEESFNQEPGEVQHIFNWVPVWDRADGVRTRAFVGNYTMELPLGSQKHQFSFTTQFLTVFDDPSTGPSHHRGDVGDTFLNYRYQLLANDDFLWCAPRFTVILPTGDPSLRLGTGEVGYQFNLPVSRYGHDFDFHFNAGFTYQPNVSLPLDVNATPLVFSPRHDLETYNLGASVFWKPKTNLHFFVECVALWNDDINDLGKRERLTQVIVNPGMRWAVIQEPVEWVLGFAVPVGLTRDAPDVGAFFYMSIEHPFRKKKEGAEKE